MTNATTAPRTGTGNSVVVGGRRLGWHDLAGPPLDGPTAVLADGHGAALAAVRRHVETGTELLVAAAGRVDRELQGDLVDAGFTVRHGAVAYEPVEARTATDGRLWILTSGSTGRPTRVAHTLASLTTVRGDGHPPRTWLNPYSPGTYAWWQLVTLWLAVPGQDMVCVEAGNADELADWPAVAAAHGVTAASGTPTFWRQTLLRSAEALRAVPLEQVTLGGEPVDQAILDRLGAELPRARVSWIYASSEAGAAITVHDGRAGFPVSWLNRPGAGRPMLAVDGDELVITSPHAGMGHDGPLRTGDRVEIAGDRVLILGRRGSDEINVGGSKVSAGAVRSRLLEHAGVRWARVYARRAPLVGSVVAAEVVLDPGAAGLDQPTLQRWAAAGLPEYAVPQLIRFRDSIPMKETLKSDV